MFDKEALNLKTVIYVIGIIAFIVSVLTSCEKIKPNPSKLALAYKAESKEDSHSEESDFWPADMVPHPHCPEDPPKEGDQA